MKGESDTGRDVSTHPSPSLEFSANSMPMAMVCDLRNRFERRQGVCRVDRCETCRRQPLAYFVLSHKKALFFSHGVSFPSKFFAGRFLWPLSYPLKALIKQ